MSKTNLTPHAVFKYLPDCVPVPDPQAGGAAVASQTLGGWYAKPGATVDVTARINVPEIRNMQYRVWRKGLDSEGMRGWPGDALYFYNAAGSLNYADANAFYIDSGSGKTLTLKLVGGGNPKSLVLYQWRVREPELGLTWINGYYKEGDIQAGDVIRFGAPSAYENTMWAMVLQVTACTDESITVRVDKDISHYTVATRDLEDGEQFTCSVWQQAGNPEKWQFGIHPTFFTAIPKTQTIEVADVPSDGIVTISTKAVAHPPGFDPLHPCFLLEGHLASDGSWNTLGNDRLYILTAGPSRVALKTAKPTEGVTAPDTDLTTTYDRFRITFYEESAPDAPGCAVPCYGRCKWSTPDYSRSVGNFGASDGVGVDPNGGHWYCRLRRYEKFELVDNYPEGSPDGLFDTANVTIHSPTGVARFPTDGQCKQFGCCDKFQAAENDTGRDGFFRVEYHLARLFRELWGNADTLVTKLAVGSNANTDFIASRVGHKSLAWLAGWYCDLHSPIGIHETLEFVRAGLWSRPLTYTDGDNTRLEAGQGYNYQLEPHLIPRDSDPADGLFPATVTDFKICKSALDPAGTISRNEIERMGIRIERDTGILRGRGMAYFPDVVASSPVVIANIDTSSTDLQHFTQGDFKKDTVTVLDSEYAGCLTILPLRQESKAEVSCGSRVVHSCAGSGDDLFTFEFTNGLHHFSHVVDGPEIGDSYDAILTWAAGGTAPIYPTDDKLINSYYETDKTVGAKSGGIAPGDMLGIGDYRFLVVDVLPFGGSAAADWGDNETTYRILTGGFFSPNSTNLETGGVGAAMINVTVTDSTSALLTPIDSIDRPSAISAGHYWWDAQAGRVLFSSSDAGQTFTVHYKVSGDETATVYDESFAVPFTVVWTLYGTAYIDYTGAVSTALKSSGAAVPSGDYSVADDGSGNIQVTFSTVDYAGCDVSLTLVSSSDNPAPDNYGFRSDYVSFAKNRDVVTVKDTSGYLTVNAGTIEGTDADFYWASGVWIDGTLTLEWAPYDSNVWQTVSTGDYKAFAGTGNIYFKDSFLIGKGVICFRATCDLIDHRGIMPAAVYQKTLDAVDALQWLETGMETLPGGAFTEFGWRKQIGYTYYIADPDNDPCTYTGPAVDVLVDGPFGYTGNQISWDALPIGSEFVSTLDFGFMSSPLGIPTAFKGFPPGTTIVQALAQISASGVTQTWSRDVSGESDCDGNVTDPGSHTEGTDVGGLFFTVLGFVTPTTYEVLGQTAATAPEGSSVIDVTAIMQQIFANREPATYPFGYGVMFAPENAGSLQPPEGALRTRTNCPGSGECAGQEYPEYYVGAHYQMHWDSLSIDRLFILPQYPDSEKLIDIIGPRQPSMAD